MSFSLIRTGAILTRNLIFQKNILINEVKIVSQLCRSYAFKSDLKIKWVRPEYVPSHKPEKSGDLEPLNDVDPKLPIFLCRGVKELEDADENVKKVFSVKFCQRQHVSKTVREYLMHRVRRHHLDRYSAEAIIADLTGQIRNLQIVVDATPKNKRLKVRLLETIDRRKKLLKRLRRWDYKRFEWILEKLNIVYKPIPADLSRPTRKGSLRKLTDMHCEKIKEDRLNEYKKELKSQQEGFLREKIEKLEFVRKEQLDCGVEVTVSQKQIDDTKKQLEAFLKNKENVATKIA